MQEAAHPAKLSISLIDGFLFSKIVKEVSVDLTKYT
jgi:hypothetical protein